MLISGNYLHISVYKNISCNCKLNYDVGTKIGTAITNIHLLLYLLTFII